MRGRVPVLARTVKFSAISLLLVAEMAVLGAMEPLARRPPAIQTEAAQVENDLVFKITGLPFGAKPVLHVAGRSSLDVHEGIPKTGEDWVSVTVSTFGYWLYPAERVRYDWELGDGRHFTGYQMAVNPNYPFAWKYTEQGQFQVYYVNPYEPDVIDRLGKSYLWLVDFLHLPQPSPQQVIYLMPDGASLNRDGIPEVTLAGLWSGRARSITSSTVFHGEELRRILVHESAHALLFNGNPVWWEEGVAVWMEETEYYTHQLLKPVRPSVSYVTAFAQLEKLAKAGPIPLDKVTYQKAKPLDPYTVGLSFLYYLQQRIGEDNLRRFVVTAATSNLSQAAKEHLGEDLATTEAKWQEYITSGSLYADTLRRLQ